MHRSRHSEVLKEGSRGYIFALHVTLIIQQVKSKIMNRKEHLLTIMAEECVETAQRASKALRFGLEEVQEGQDLTNAERIVYEFNDLYAIMELLRREGHIPRVLDLGAIDLKMRKVEKWLKYSEEKGTLSPEKCDHDFAVPSPYDKKECIKCGHTIYGDFR
jgi:hypothetical protein